MHKKIKLIIATSLILGVVSGILPANNYVTLGTTKAFASSHDDDDDEYIDEAHLDGIYLSEGDIDFNKDTTEYNVNVKKETSEITIEAKPEDNDYIVEINGSSVDKNDDYKKKVKLEEGNNTIKIYVESDDEDETYTLNIYRGDLAKVVDSKTGKVKESAQTFSISSKANKFNGWNRIDGKLKYLDGTGQVLKNIWWFDKSVGLNYYLKEDGSRTTGWFQNNNNWYYFNENGEMKTGWVSINKNWYFLSKSGVMKMGWLEDSDGNWYYLDNDGAMKTGWVDGSNGKWFYLDSTGKMIKDSTVSGYHLGTDGVLAN